jgi:uncharacterized membrane protein YgcG
MNARILLALALALVPATALAAVPDPPPLTGRPVVDAANIIPDADEAALDHKLMEIQKRSHHQVAILTVPDLQGYSIVDYGVNAGRKWGIGSKYSDDGVLLTIAPKEHKKRIDVGYGLGEMLTDAQSILILSKATPAFKQGDYVGGINGMVDDIADAITPLTPAQQLVQQREEQNRKAQAAAAWAKFVDFLMTTLGVAALAGGIFALYWKATAPARRRRREEREAAAEEERQRIAAAYERDRQARLEAERRAQREREEMLAKMSPAERHAFLEKERLEREAAEERARERERQRQIADAARRKREEEEESVSYGGGYSGGSSSSSSSDDDSFSGGGGSFGGGGADDSW